MKMDKLKRGDRVVIARLDPKHGACGFKVQIVGLRGVVEGVAIAPDYGEAYVVGIIHPISKRAIAPTFPAGMLDKLEADAPIVVRGKQ